jgi:hypothetical protein
MAAARRVRETRRDPAAGLPGPLQGGMIRARRRGAAWQ